MQSQAQHARNVTRLHVAAQANVEGWRGNKDVHRGPRRRLIRRSYITCLVRNARQLASCDCLSRGVAENLCIRTSWSKFDERFLRFQLVSKAGEHRFVLLLELIQVLVPNKLSLLHALYAHLVLLWASRLPNPDDAIKRSVLPALHRQDFSHGLYPLGAHQSRTMRRNVTGTCHLKCGPLSFNPDCNPDWQHNLHPLL